MAIWVVEFPKEGYKVGLNSVNSVESSKIRYHLRKQARKGFQSPIAIGYILSKLGTFEKFFGIFLDFLGIFGGNFLDFSWIFLGGGFFC